MAKVVTAAGLTGAFIAVISGLIALICTLFMFWPGIIGGIIGVIIGVMLRSRSS